MVPQTCEALNVNPGVESLGHLAGQQWYAVYTCAHHEKKIAEEFTRRSIEQFLPLYETVRRWKDRKMRLQLPLFPSYVFVRVDLPERLKILQVPGVVRFVSFNGKPAALPEGEMLALRRGLNSGLRAEPHAHIEIGHPVRVKSGPLCGLSGKLLRRKDNCRIIISVDSISRSIVCEVSPDDIELGRPALTTPRPGAREVPRNRQAIPGAFSGGGVV